MAYYRKNKRRFDPRYFMNERIEQIDEMIPGDPGAEPSLARADKEEEFTDEEFPQGMKDLPPAEEDWIELQNKIKKWGRGGLSGEREYMQEGLEEEEEESEFSIHIKVFPEQAQPNILSGNDLDAMVKTAEIWKKNPAIEISYMSPEIEKRLDGGQDLEES